jgi:hypothetical protein
MAVPLCQTRRPVAGFPHPTEGCTGSRRPLNYPVHQHNHWAERHGLLSPARIDGGALRYSADDLTRIERIVTLVAAGVNIAGIGRILDLEDANTALRQGYSWT